MIHPRCECECGCRRQRLLKQPARGLNSWDMDAEIGDRVYEPAPGNIGQYYIHDLRESRGRNKSAAGELTPVTVKKNGKPRLAELSDDGYWYWSTKKEARA